MHECMNVRMYDLYNTMVVRLYITGDLGETRRDM